MPSRKYNYYVSNQKGAFFTLFSVTFVLLIAFSALAIDLGTVYVHKIRLQNAADAAALAGASQLNQTLTYSLCSSVTDNYVAPYTIKNLGDAVERKDTYVDPGNSPESSFSETVSNVNITACYYNAVASDVTGSRKLTVELRQRVSLYFMRYFGFHDMPVAVMATARFTPDSSGGSGSGTTAGNPFDYLLYASDSITTYAENTHFHGTVEANKGLDISVAGNKDLQNFLATHENGSTTTISGKTYDVIVANKGNINRATIKNGYYVIIALDGNITLNISRNYNERLILYAPNGTVTIQSEGNNVWGSIVAKNIVIDNNSTNTPKEYNYHYIDTNPFPNTTPATSTKGSTSLIQ